MIPPAKLQLGDRIRVIAPSRSLGGLISLNGFSDQGLEDARRALAELGLESDLGSHIRECDDFLSTSIEARIADLEDAYHDPDVRGIMALAGGANAIQLLRQLDFDLIASRPKVFCGYSDVGTLLNAIYAKTGVVGYYGPNVAGLAQEFGREYTLRGMKQCLMSDSPFTVVPSTEWSIDGENAFENDGPFCITEGEAEGVLLGGGLHCLSALRGTPFLPLLDGSVLLLESPLQHRKATLPAIDAALESLILQPGFDGVRAIVFGRFHGEANMTRERLASLVTSKPELDGVPVVAGLDFGHTLPRATLPIGGTARLTAREDSVVLEIIRF